MADRVKPGQQVAIAVGSRGIASLREVCRAVVGWLQAQGASPYIVPAMGSHGGGTAQGQESVLAALGITEQEVGAPVRPCMATVQVGAVSPGVAVHTAELAATADLVIPIARVKPHTDFRGRFESGPTKMLAIGLGNRDGAESLHSVGLRNLSETIAEAGRLLIRILHVPFCVAIVEDAHEAAGIIEVIPAERIPDREPELLDVARAWMPFLPVPALDVLLVQQMGKDISGNGMDPNITGRFYDSELTGGTAVERLVALDLTGPTGGNATGIGVADVVTARLASRIDWHTTYTNEMTAGTPAGARLPLVAVDDEEALAIAVRTLGRPPSAVGIVWIQDTLHLSTMMASVPVLEALPSEVRVLAEPRPVVFSDGKLLLPSLIP